MSNRADTSSEKPSSMVRADITNGESPDADTDEAVRRTTQEEEDEKAVRSVELDTEDGGTVVIEQQNMGGAQQVGGGEYKNVSSGRTVEEAAAEQARLEREAPVDGTAQ
jgi:hypothetical protein